MEKPIYSLLKASNSRVEALCILQRKNEGEIQYEHKFIITSCIFWLNFGKKIVIAPLVALHRMPRSIEKT